MEAQIVVLRSEFEADKAEVVKDMGIERTRYARSTKDKVRTAKRRSGVARGDVIPIDKADKGSPA